jgi:hypothetical protein
MLASVSSALEQAFDDPYPAPHPDLLARPRVITLCGSTRFMDAFEQANRTLTLKGNVVFSVATKAHEGSADISPAQKELLDRVHFEKIRLSDEIYVLNVDGYVGPSTAREIEFAKRIGRVVHYLVPPDGSEASK